MYTLQTDHTLPSDSIMTVGAYGRRFGTYFTLLHKKRKNKKADLEN